MDISLVGLRRLRSRVLVRVSGCKAGRLREMFTPCRAEGDPCMQMEAYGWWDTVSYLLPFANYFLLGDGCPDGRYCAVPSKAGTCGTCNALPREFERCGVWDECAAGTTCLGGYCLPLPGEGEVCQGRPSDCDAATCANEGCPGSPVSRPCGPGLYCGGGIPAMDPCEQVLCIPYGQTCTSVRECGPGMKCYDKACIPEHEHPEFKGPVEKCGGRS